MSADELQRKKRALRKTMVEHIPGARSPAATSRRGASGGRLICASRLRGGPVGPAIRHGLSGGGRHRSVARANSRARQGLGLPHGRSGRRPAPALPDQRPSAGTGTRYPGHPRAAPRLPRGRPRSHRLGASSLGWPLMRNASASAACAGHYDRLAPDAPPRRTTLGPDLRLSVGRRLTRRAARCATRRGRLPRKNQSASTVTIGGFEYAWKAVAILAVAVSPLWKTTR